LASPIHAEESRVGVVILLTDKPTLDARLLDFHREIQEPLDETAACLEELLEASTGPRGEHFLELVERSAATLGRARKWSGELHRLLAGEAGAKSSDEVLQPGRVLRDVASRLQPELERAKVEFAAGQPGGVSGHGGPDDARNAPGPAVCASALGMAPAGSSMSLLARDVGGALGPGVLISLTDPHQSSNSGTENVNDPGEYTRMVRELVSVLGVQIATVVEPPAGRVTSIWLRSAPN
jgi:hypothetical protein